MSQTPDPERRPLRPGAAVVAALLTAGAGAAVIPADFGTWFHRTDAGSPAERPAVATDGESVDSDRSGSPVSTGAMHPETPDVDPRHPPAKNRASDVAPASTDADRPGPPTVESSAVPMSNPPVAARTNRSLTADGNDSPESVRAGIVELCERIGEKLSSVTTDECLATRLDDSRARSTAGTAIAYRDFGPDTGDALARVLLVGGIHGDEYSSVSVVFKWLAMLDETERHDFHWRVVPLLNPDGLLMPPDQSQRMNANGVDLNRNFPTPDWDTEAHNYWVHRARRNARRYPGPAALSEPESAWLADQIETFRPDAVISVHAPHGIVDFDGPKIPPDSLGPLELRLLGTYPGSMGRYIGIHKGIPILTVELESAGRMPRSDDLNDIWKDTLSWLNAKLVSSERLAIQDPADATDRSGPMVDHDG